MAVMKSEPDGKHPSSHYLVVEDEESPSTWHLRFKAADGTIDHRLVGACWAALHGGYRGNTYHGPNKAEALAKLKAIYKDQGWPLPDSGKGDEDTLDLKATSSAMEFKDFAFTLETADDMAPDTFKGYGSIVGNVDTGGDVVMPGAFANTLDFFLTKGKICWQHDWNEPIGKPTDAKEDGRGLFLTGHIVDTPEGSKALKLMRAGVIGELSIGYKATRAHWLSETEGKALFGDEGYKAALDRLPMERTRIRALDEVKLFEVSPVTFAMNDEAVVTGVKGWPPAGLPLESHVEMALAAVSDVRDRFQRVSDLRVKEGRVLSAANVSKLQSLKDPLMAVLETIDKLLDSVLPPDEDTPAKAEAEARAAALSEWRRLRLRVIETEQRIKAAS
jgi:HK97 family phage prohead protease